MSPWLFNSSPMIEWRYPMSKTRSPTDRPEELTSISTGQPEDDRFPSDTVIHYRTFRDHESRESKVAFLEFGPKPRRCSELVDHCWVHGVPLILWFQEPPDWSAPHWKETLTTRSIHATNTGRLRWRPIVSWQCDQLEGAIEELSDWLTKGLPFFPLPILRVEFSEEIPFEGIGEMLLEMAANPLPCRFKLFAISHSHRGKISSDQWREILKGFQDLPAEQNRESEVIPLYPEK